MSIGTACPPTPITALVCGGVLYPGVNSKKVIRHNSG